MSIKEYTSENHHVTAVQWLGTAESSQDFYDLLGVAFQVFEYRGKPLPLGSWIIQFSNRELAVLGDPEFKRLFAERPPHVIDRREDRSGSEFVTVEVPKPRKKGFNELGWKY